MVDKNEPGFGPIHYIAQGKHVFKTKLLVILAIYGNADLDLTTTHKDQVTALHLAVEVSWTFAFSRQSYMLQQSSVISIVPLVTGKGPGVCKDTHCSRCRF